MNMYGKMSRYSCQECLIRTKSTNWKYEIRRSRLAKIKPQAKKYNFAFKNSNIFIEGSFKRGKIIFHEKKLKHGKIILLINFISVRSFSLIASGQIFKK